jgi:hypothetical protein
MSHAAIGRSATIFEKPSKDNKVAEAAEVKIERSATTKHEKKSKQIDDDIKDFNLDKEDEDG